MWGPAERIERIECVVKGTPLHASSGYIRTRTRRSLLDAEGKWTLSPFPSRQPLTPMLLALEYLRLMLLSKRKSIIYYTVSDPRELDSVTKEVECCGGDSFQCPHLSLGSSTCAHKPGRCRSCGLPPPGPQPHASRRDSLTPGLHLGIHER
ncbi:unnamed protein product [Merluccius merluccius]